jgi:hypothetical protein
MMSMSVIFAMIVVDFIIVMAALGKGLAILSANMGLRG